MLVGWVEVLISLRFDKKVPSPKLAQVSTQVFLALKYYKNESKSPLERGFRGVLGLKT